MTENNCAEHFDEPIESDVHRLVRDTAWIGGSLIEGKYLLGILIGKNLFRVTVEEYYETLHDYLCENVSREVAGLFTTIDIVILYMRLVYHENGNLPVINVERKHRAEHGVAFLFQNLDATVAEIASHLKTTEKQVQ